MTPFKRFQFILCALALSFLVSCNSKDQSAKETTETELAVDTVIVRDTIFVNDASGSAELKAHISAEKMNVLYIGVDNPIQVSGSTDSDYELLVMSGPASVKKTARNRFSVTASNPGECVLALKDIPSSHKTFRIKRIPDPRARLGSKSSGDMGNGEFKAQGGVMALLEYFDFDVQCSIAGFTLIYIPKRQDPIEVINSGARYSANARNLVSRAKPGDIFIFENVRAKCPGDAGTRKINSMFFKIK